jgi:hypothetical protein
MMQNDIQHVLSSMLADWHKWSSHTHTKGGYPGRAAGFGQAKSNSQYDWESGIESDLVDRRIMEGFDATIQRIPQPWNTALHFEARNLAVRYQVWSSPRLPKDLWERQELILDARNRLLKELAKDGVLC